MPNWNWSAMGITQELFSALNTCFGPVRSRLPTDRERGGGGGIRDLPKGEEREGKIRQGEEMRKREDTRRDKTIRCNKMM